MSKPSLLLVMDTDDKGRSIVAEEIGDAANVTYLADLADGDRAAALKGADVALARNTAKELRTGEAELLADAKLIQFFSAGIDFVPLGDLPEGVPIACNGGAFAEPMAEHALAMALAAVKRIVPEHENLKRGEFNQFNWTRMLTGKVCGILGFGGIGIATAKLMRAMGMQVHAINRSGRGHDAVDWMGKPDQLGELLANSDVLVLAVPLSRQTEGMIDAGVLGQMKEDAILINLARGEVVKEADLYDHLVAHPDFIACIDAWWVEPIRHGAFRMDRPFLDLPNVLGSPHNSASVTGWRHVAMSRALQNCRRVINGEEPQHLLGPEDRFR